MRENTRKASKSAPTSDLDGSITKARAALQMSIDDIHALRNANASEIDLDSINERLELSLNTLQELQTLERELILLKVDLVSRITSMERAIAVTVQSAKYDESAGAPETSVALDATELLRRLQMTSARFRDVFPTSMGRLWDGAMTRRTNNSWDDFRSASKDVARAK